MQKVFKSMYVQTVYSLLSGIVFLTISDKTLLSTGFTPTSKMWVSAIGILTLSLCFHYYLIARSGSVSAVMGTVYGRWFFTGVGAICAIAGFVPKVVIPAMIFEAGLAYWSWRETKTSSTKAILPRT